jgi:hypothetical protein
MIPTAPQIGSEVTVTVRNAMADFRHLYGSGVITEHVTFTGTVVANEKWLTNHLSITTGIKSFPVRSVDTTRIVSINGVKSKSVKAAVSKTRTWIVAGSRGQNYTVTEENGRRSCTCPGYHYRSNCKHLHKIDSTHSSSSFG